MRIGIPKEIKTYEARVALLPAACAELVKEGHEVLIETHAGLKAGYDNDQYQLVGCQITESAEQTYSEAELVVKVKEPQPEEVRLLRPDHIVFSYLHLAAEPELLASLKAAGVTAIGFETVQEDRQLPLLAPMSDIAGRLSVQIGATLLHNQNAGRGVLLGGLAGAERGQIVILGAGVAGGHAALVAQSLGANVTIFDPNRDKLTQMRAFGPNVTALFPTGHDIEHYVSQADLLIGAVLLPGAKAPKLVSHDLVKNMQAGSVIIDISVDQGGCIETTQPTTYENPTYIVEDVVHFGVTNMPGAVPRSASQALSAALLPYILRLTKPDWKADKVLRNATNVEAGEIVYPTLLT
jgi:alanine dehydrogenase